jgi:hypothetical protein
VVLHRCRPRNSEKSQAKAAALRMKKAPRTNGRLKKRGMPAEKEDRSAVVDVDGWYRRQQM